MIKSYKIRIYPTKEQEQKLWQHIGCSRFLYNYMIDFQSKNYEAGNRYVGKFNMINMLTNMRNSEELGWMSDLSRASQALICGDVDTAFKNFFAGRARYPRFKSRKRSKSSFPVRAENTYFVENRYVNVEKVGKIRYKTDFDLPQGRHTCKFSNVRISNVLNKWIMTLGIECENQVRELSDVTVGIDLGVKELAVVEHDGECIVFHNINKSRKMRLLNKRIKSLQRKISRKYEANKVGNRFVKTNNIIRCEEELRRLHAKVANIRENYIHQVTHAIVELLPNTIVVEDLNVTGMMRNRHLSRAIAEQCFNKFITFLQYKCEWNGINFVKADMFFPSSKTCSCCGSIKHDLKLKDRTFACNECGFEIDRDYNAAINLSRYTA